MNKTESIKVMVAEAYDALAGTTATRLFEVTTGVSPLTAGEITIIDAETRRLATASSKIVSFAWYDKIQAGTVVGDPIVVADDLDARVTAYEAPVKQVYTVQMTSGGAGITAGLSYILRIGVKSWTDVFSKEFAPKPYNVKIPSGTVNPDQYLATQFNTLINADKGSPVVSTVAGDTITLTAKEFGIQFLPTIGEENWVDAVITETVAWVRGSGAYTQVLAEEEAVLGYRGDLYRNHNVLRTVASTTYAVSTSTYDCYMVHAINGYANRGIGPNRAQIPVVHKIYFKSDAATKAAFDTLFDSIFGT
jgi:hypothetical protein